MKVAVPRCHAFELFTIPIRLLFQVRVQVLTTSPTALFTLPISSYPFSSFPVPSASPIPGTFPSTSPRSPPPPGSNLIPDFGPAWAEAHSKAQQFIAGWSVEDKVNSVTGVGWQNGRCVGNIGAVGSWPGLCLEDSPLGVRLTDFVTAFPAGITVASTWNRTLLRARAAAMGAEFRGKGVHVALGPMVNMGRIAQGGRNWEGFGADPYLTGEGAYETVLGLQQAGVQACAKHYVDKCVFSVPVSVKSGGVSDGICAASRSKSGCRRARTSTIGRNARSTCIHSCAPCRRASRASCAATVRAPVSHMAMFLADADGGTWTDQINASWACENDQTLNQILKGENGFQGYVMSDWGAHHSTLAAVNGLDVSPRGSMF